MTDNVREGIRPAVCLHRRNVAKDEIRMIVACAISSTIEMHTNGLKTSAKSERKPVPRARAC
jgi:hypothetical protein